MKFKSFVRGLLTVGLLSCSALAQASDPNWSSSVVLPANGRSNPYALPNPEWSDAIRAGRLHTLHYPVSVTAILLPYEPLQKFIEADHRNPLRKMIETLLGDLTQFRRFDDVERWLGLVNYPEREGEIPFPKGKRPDHRMGLTMVDTPRGKGFTISCAQCHASQLFGRPVLGLSNRSARANEFFYDGLKAAPLVNPLGFRVATAATRDEAAMYADVRRALTFIDAKKPVQLGLDTSLAQVALSLAKRAQDPWASKIPGAPARPEPLKFEVADSKPAVWWNLKYKTRWLSDGSVVSGNPIYTNILWNELGRGTDLHQLNDWFRDNDQTIRELATAVFATEAPRFTDFFAANLIDEAAAKRGERHFEARCARCHGHYEKAWSLPESALWSLEDRLRTTEVRYRQPTPVMDVGTDPGRYLGMRSLAKLNDLEISKRQGIVIEPQKGYVPPPLVGIWSRWPYFHNNSAPTLCAVLTRAELRPKTYWARAADDASRDFDQECNGYPLNAPSLGTPARFRFDTRREGLHNSGHDERIFLENGREVLSASDKRDLIQFLKTL